MEVVDFDATFVLLKIFIYVTRTLIMCLGFTIRILRILRKTLRLFSGTLSYMLDFLGFSLYFTFLHLTSTPIDWCYNQGRPSSKDSSTHIFVVCYCLERGKKWKKFWIYRAS
ncbi:hypothetical protein KC19_8G003500 [Ceratodon purpureus]|uniref:Uncharacterized protein n=1 Tax=Ceratodon purpureus TaxID=3225 RepID=A0A8T0GWZ9_CERPU|nr:hypothetical protein KC19_8G003500 [Ceratodon purpureus]